MPTDTDSLVAQVLGNTDHDLAAAWLEQLTRDGALDSGRIREAELRAQCTNFLNLLRGAVQAAAGNVDDAAYDPIRDFLADLSHTRAVQGFTPRETALFVFSLKRPLFAGIAAVRQLSAEQALAASEQVTAVVDRLGLHTMETFQRSREELIVRQQEELAELSTPVIKLWHGVLALPLIGTLDSQRTQVVMEKLLEAIVAQSAEIAIIDITGVPTVDTLTAQHLLKTVAAARLMGADCIISGIRPQIAQTMVHLGVELSVVSKATLADAFGVALARQGRAVTRLRKPADAPAPR